MSNRPKRKNTRPIAASASASASKAWWMSPLVWVGALAAIALAVVIAISVSGGDTTAQTETAFAETLGAPLSRYDAALTPDPAVGADAPDIAAHTFDDTRVDIAVADGTVRVVGFFAHWCPHCQAELPRIVDWLADNDLPTGVELVFVSTSVDKTLGNYPPSAWFQREEYDGPVLADSGSNALASGYGLSGWPYFVLVDGDGKVLDRMSGELTTRQLDDLMRSAAAATTTTPTEAEEAASGVRVVAPAEAADLLADPPANLVILDVRTPEEFAEGHLEGAELLDFYDPDFAARLAELDPDVPYLLYCRSGNRSAQARQQMVNLGFTDVADIEGGIVGWTAGGHPTVGS